MLVLLVLTPLVLFIALQMGPVRHAVVDRVLQSVNEELAGTIEVEAVEGSLLGFARVVDLRIVDDRGNLAAHVEQVEVDFRISPLLRRRVIVDAVDVEGATAVVRTYEDETLNWDLVVEPEPFPRVAEEPFDWPITVARLALASAQIAYLDETVEVDPKIEGLANWRARRIADLNDAVDGPDLMGRFQEDFLQPGLDGPRAPLAMWITDLDSAGSFEMIGSDMSAEFAGLDARLASDILPDSHPLAIDAVTATLSATTIGAEIEEFRFDQWLEADLLTVAMVTPPPFEPGTLITEQMWEERPPFETMVVDLGRWTVSAGALAWAAPDVAVEAPLHLEGQIAMDPSDLTLHASVSPGDTEQLVDTTLTLSDYDSDHPGFDFAVETENFELQRWLADPELPSFRTSARATGEGRGFDPETMEATVEIRLDDTLFEEDYEADLIYADLAVDGGVIEVTQFSALTPYLDLFASGRLDMDGQVELDLQTTADAERAGPAIDMEARADRAELALTLDARFDPDFEDPMEAVLEAQTRAEWDFADLDVGDFSLAASEGSLALEAQRDQAQPGVVYSGSYHIDLQARAAQFEANQVGRLTMRDNGSFMVRADVDEPLDGLLLIDNDAVIRARNLRTLEGNLTQANLSIALSKTDPQRRRLSARLNADLTGVNTGDLRAGRIVAEANADLGLRRGGQPIEDLGAAIDFDAANVSVDGNIIGELQAQAALSARLDDREDIFEMVRHFELALEGRAGSFELADDGGVIDSAEFSADLSGPLDDPTGQVRLEAHEIEVADQEVERFLVTAVILEELRRAQIDADIERESESYHTGFLIDFEPRYEAFDLTNLIVGTDRAEWRSTEEALLRWTGTRIEAHQFFLADDEDEQTLSALGHFEPGANQDLELALQIDIEDFLDGFYLQPFFPDLSGELRASANLGGTSLQPTIDVAFGLEEFHFGLVGPFDIDLSASYEDEQFQIHHLETAAFDEDIFALSALLPVAIDLEGRAEVFEDRYAELELFVHPQELRDFHEPIPLLNDFGIDGEAAMELRWSGLLEDPDLELDLQLQDFQFQGEVGDEFFDLRDIDLRAYVTYSPVVTGGEGLDFDVEVTWEDERAARVRAISPFPLEDWLVALAEGRAEEIDWRNEFLGLPFELVVDVPALDLERIPVEVLRENNLGGRAELDIDVRGTLEDPQGDFAISLAELGWRQFRNIDFEINAELRDQQALIDGVELTWGRDQILSAEGLVPLPIPAWLAGEAVSDLPVDFRVDLHEIPLSRLSAIDYQFARIQGTIAASLEATGSLRQPAFAAEAGIYDTRLGDGSLGTIHLEVGGADDQVDLAAGLIRQEQHLVALMGELPINLDLIALINEGQWQADGDLRLDLESEPLDLADVLPTQLIADFVDDPEGLLEFALNLRGTWEQPTVTGFFQIDDGALTLPEYARRFVDINGRIDVVDDRFDIDHFELHDGPSSFAVAGTVGHELFIPDAIDLDMEADQFNVGGLAVDFPLFLTADLTAQGNLAGDPGEIDLRISGLDVRMTDEWDRTLHSTTLDPDIVFVDGRGAAPAADIIDEDPLEEPTLNLLVQVIIDRDAWLRHPVGDINFQADLDVDITGTTVAISGAVDALRGELEFLGRRFSVQDSTVTFTGAVPPNPRLRLEAFHFLDRAITAALGPPSTGEPRVIIRISGTADEPRLELSADPAMSETDILFVLMTGRPPDRSDIGRDEGVANQALAAVSGLFLGLLQDELAGTVPVDVLRLEPGAAGMRGGRLELGTYLTNDLFVAYRRQFGADENVPSNIVRLEYHFLPRWMVELLYTDRNEGELNLFWDVF